MIKNYMKLIRVKHWIKNFLIFIPLVFSGLLFNSNNLLATWCGFFAFCFTSSIIYIINDIKDIEKDRLHEVKRTRPLASGVISIKNALEVAGLLFFLSIFFVIFSTKLIDNRSYIYLVIYFIINIAYSMGLKNVPILDILILVYGFVLRVLFGAEIIDVQISDWLYLTIMSLSFYLGLGKRRNEFSHIGSNTRKVLKSYNIGFLDKFMYLFLALTIVFYSLWAKEFGSNDLMMWSIPIVVAICMKYSLIVEGNSLGDPTEVLLSDKVLILLSVFYIFFVFVLLYF